MSLFPQNRAVQKALGALAVLATVLPIMLGFGQSSHAGQGGVPMSVTILPKHYCQIVISQSGTLGVDNTNTTLSSRLADGSAALVEVTATNASFDLFYDMPGSFTVEPVDNPGPITFNGSVSGSGATTFTDVAPSTKIDMKKGVTNVTAHLDAVNQGGSYAAGNYTAEAVVRCE